MSVQNIRTPTSHERFDLEREREKLRDIAKLAQVQLDSIATGTEQPVQFASLLIEIRDIAEDLLK